MEFADQVAELSKRSKSAEQLAHTEEATKTSVVLPLIQALGFDPFDLQEVVPEFTADVGTKKGEKVDFAIKIDGKVAILIEAKPISARLGDTQFSQLFRYFSVTDARLALLTNGREVWFFSDVDAPNKMDKKPFFVFDLHKYDAKQVDELSRFRKSGFSIETILEAASNLKYTKAAASYIKSQLQHPEEDFVKLVGRQIHDGMLTKAVVEQLRPAIQAALDEVIRDRIQDRLNVAFRPDAPMPEAQPDEVDDATNEIQTTEEETQAFLIVRAIAAKVIDVNRITIRDARSCCSVFVDDNNRKPVCRFYFNGKKAKYVGLFDADKTEEKLEMAHLEELYSHAEKIEAAISAYL